MDKRVVVVSKSPSLAERYLINRLVAPGELVMGMTAGDLRRGLRYVQPAFRMKEELHQAKVQALAVGVMLWRQAREAEFGRAVTVFFEPEAVGGRPSPWGIPVIGAGEFYLPDGTDARRLPARLPLRP